VRQSSLTKPGTSGDWPGYQATHLICPSRQSHLGWQPSRFLADRAEAERAFQLAEQLGSVNAAATQLDTTWPSLRKGFTRHALGMPPRNPAGDRWEPLGSDGVAQTWTRHVPLVGAAALRLADLGWQGDPRRLPRQASPAWQSPC
jgi:hypothetical protein